MSDIDKAALEIGQSARLVAAVLGMQAENMQRHHRGESMAYDENAFQGAIRTYFPIARMEAKDAR